MREFKFRVWDKKTKQFLNQKEHYLTLDGSGIVYNYKELDLGLLGADSGNFVIQQFTGLKDKNGREIYEGDIIKQQHHDHSKAMKFETQNYEVKFQTMVETHGKYYSGFYADVFEIYKYCEVIGNIFENPELLK